MKSISDSAKEYANHAEKFVYPTRMMLLNGNALLALQRLAGKYRIARNFRKQFDVGRGLERLAPVLETLQKIDRVALQNPITLVSETAVRLSEIYQRNVLSASSKFLWYYFGRDVVIYDSQAVAFLQRDGHFFEKTNYAQYFNAWKKSYAKHEVEIRRTCREEKLPDDEPFLERVFDWYAWSNGKL